MGVNIKYPKLNRGSTIYVQKRTQSHKHFGTSRGVVGMKWSIRFSLSIHLLFFFIMWSHVSGGLGIWNSPSEMACLCKLNKHVGVTFQYFLKIITELVRKCWQWMTIVNGKDIPSLEVKKLDYTLCYRVLCNFLWLNNLLGSKLTLLS